MSKKMKWTRNAEIELIQEVREKPILWDISHPQYNRTDLKAVSWEKVAEALGSPVTNNLAKERFENLRTTFMRNEKKIKVTTSSGKGTDDIYKPKWDLYPLLSFLKKTTAQAASVSNLDIDTDSSAISTNSETNENVNIASNIYFDENLQKWVMIPKDTEIIDAEIVPSEIPPSTSSFSEMSESNLSSSPSSTYILPQTPTNTKKRTPITRSDDMYIKRGRKDVDNSSSVMEEAVAALKDLTKEKIPQTDGYDHFGAYVAAQLRVMTPEQSGHCEIEIVKILKSN